MVLDKNLVPILGFCATFFTVLAKNLVPSSDSGKVCDDLR